MPSSYKYSVYKSSYQGGRRSSGGNKRRGEYIDPARLVRKATPVEASTYVPKNRFEDFAVNPLIKSNLAVKGFVNPSPIQDQTIHQALEGKDIIGIANTGTGKTAAFAIPVLNALMLNKDARALVVAPTRELAQQIEQECRSIGKGSHLAGALLIGGANIVPQLRDLRSDPQIVVGTPGRIKDHLERGSLRLRNFNFVVLDEVDRMLDMGFINDVRDILNELAEERQSFFFSATMDNKVEGLINSFSNDPFRISLKSSEGSENVNQDVIRYAGPRDKMDKLHDILLQPDVKAIIFDETQRSVERLNQDLLTLGFKADAIHGGKSQGQRQRALDSFKSNRVKVLVATDVAARGIDVKDVTHVINFSMPQSYQDYVHRIGRAGRAGRTGHAFTFVN